MGGGQKHWQGDKVRCAGGQGGQDRTRPHGLGAAPPGWSRPSRAEGPTPDPPCDSTYLLTPTGHPSCRGCVSTATTGVPPPRSPVLTLHHPQSASSSPDCRLRPPRLSPSPLLPRHTSPHLYTLQMGRVRPGVSGRTVPPAPRPSATSGSKLAPLHGSTRAVAGDPNPGHPLDLLRLSHLSPDLVGALKISKNTKLPPGSAFEEVTVQNRPDADSSVAWKDGRGTQPRISQN